MDDLPDEELDSSEGARIFKALQEARVLSLGPITVRPKGPNKEHRRPATPMEALMQAKPHEEPIESTQEAYERQDALRAAVEETWATLTETEQWIYNMLVDVGLSLRFIAIVLGTPKTTMARRRDELAEKIKNGLLQHQVVIDEVFQNVTRHNLSD